MALFRTLFSGETLVIVFVVVLLTKTHGCHARTNPQTDTGPLITTTGIRTGAASGEKIVSISAGDVIDEVNRIEGEFNDQVIDRNTVTCNIVNHFLSAFPSYNAIAVHSQHLASLQGSYHESLTVPTSRFKDTTFDIYVFLSGTFTLLGDGGEINWCIGGNYVQNGNTITFSNRD